MTSASMAKVTRRLSGNQIRWPQESFRRRHVLTPDLDASLRKTMSIDNRLMLN